MEKVALGNVFVKPVMLGRHVLNAHMAIYLTAVAFVGDVLPIVVHRVIFLTVCAVLEMVPLHAGVLQTTLEVHVKGSIQHTPAGAFVTKVLVLEENVIVAKDIRAVIATRPLCKHNASQILSVGVVSTVVRNQGFVYPKIDAVGVVFFWTMRVRASLDILARIAIVLS